MSTAATAPARDGVEPADAPAGPPASPRRPTRPPRRAVLGALAALAAVAVVAGAVGYLVGRSSGEAAAPTASPTSLPASAVDIGFAQDMLDHHDQAVQLASFAEAHATTPMVRSMAAAVLGSQRYEIGVFEQFLRDRGSARGDPGRTVMGWMGMPRPFDQMNGLQPSATVVDFLNRQGADVDRRFLELMIDHHEGGVHMATYAADHASDPALRDLASRMVVEQQTELGDYQAALPSAG